MQAGPTKGPSAPEQQKVALEKFAAAAQNYKEMDKSGNVDLAALQGQFRDVLKIDPSFYEAFFDLGVIAEKQNKPDEAMKDYRSAASLNEKFAPAVENIAALLVQQGKADDAIALLEKFVQNDAVQASPRVRLAKLYLGKKKYDEAANQCRAALQREPKNLPAFETLAMTYEQSGNRPMAKLVAARGFKVDDKSAALHYTIGRIDLEENKIPEAVAEFKAALQARPDMRPARVDLAEVALSYRDFGNAKTNYQALVKMDAADEPSWIGLGISDKGLGQFDDAKAAYQHVLDGNPKDSVALFDLATLYHRNLNDFANALKYYQMYLDNPSPDGPKTDVVKGYVTELEQTIAALKEAEKLQQMQDAQQKQQAQQQQAPAPAAGGQAASTPASAPAAEPAK